MLNCASTQTIISLNDSILSKNTGLLTNSLNYNTVLYFKEYVSWMLSTVAFSTTSSQTAVIWNG
jgi:iron complex outermembrane receptor protein